MIILIAVGVVVFLLVLWFLPERQLASWKDKIPDPDWLKLKNETRATLAQILGGALVLSGAYFTYANMKDTERIADSTLEISRASLNATQSSQLAERFTKAIGQLSQSQENNQPGHKPDQQSSLAVRLGGIYALEQIYSGPDNNSKEYHLPIVQIFTAYIRDKALWREREQAILEDQKKQTPTCESDIQSATSRSATKGTLAIRTPIGLDLETIIGFLAHRKWASEEQENNYLDLHGVDLGGLGQATLAGANFDRADLSQAFLEHVRLPGAQLRNVNLKRAHLEGADLTNAVLAGAVLTNVQMEHARLEAAHLENADLSDAQLKGAILSGAYLQKAVLAHAYLENADLSGAHLEEAELVSEANLKGATLSGAYLNGAHLSGACLAGAHLENAHLNGAYLSKANMKGTTLAGTDLTGALLDGAQLQDTDLSGTVGLTWDQLSRAHIDDTTKLPLPLEERRRQEQTAK